MLFSLASSRGFHRRAVTQLAFSQDGKKLATIGQVYIPLLL
jgi:hypothetical protein